MAMVRFGERARVQQEDRFKHIDAMRAVAVLLVVWMHFAEGLMPVSGSQLWLGKGAEAFNFGRIGVVVFFAISGMLIPSSLRPGPGAIKRFATRRFFRLFPAFWLSVIVYWIILPGAPSVEQLLANLTMLPWMFGEAPLLGLYWTLETELYFYVLCAIIFCAGRLHDQRVISGIAAVMSAAFVVSSAAGLYPADLPGPYKGLLLHLAIMFWGASFRHAWASGRYGSPSFLIASVAVLCAAAAVLGYGVLSADPKQISNGAAYLIALALFVAMVTVARITFRPFVFLGRISYSIYLLHGASLTAFLAVIGAAGEAGHPLSLYMITCAALAIIVSVLSYCLVEQPGIALGAASAKRVALPVYSLIRKSPAGQVTKSGV
jgi:peptidoglycan/LPS O-acetylase OafA/YrhL